MSFLKSTVNQVGRDMGKVISNQIFNSSHSTPYRRVLSNNTYTRTRTTFQTDFEKAINFQTGHRPSTLISKISGVYVVIKNEANTYISDGYLDTSESNELFYMMNQFNNKVDDICDVLEIDEISNEKEINQLKALVNKMNNLFNEILSISAIGCNKREKEHKIEAKNVKNISFLEYLGFNIIWMGNYARGKEKSILNTVLANIADLVTFTFPFTRTYLFLKGVFTYSKENKRRNTLKNAHIKLAELEGKRAETYLSISNK